MPADRFTHPVSNGDNVHQQARDFIASSRSRLSVLEIGSRNVNGSLRDLFEGWNFTGIDSCPGDGVDIVADGGTWDGDGRQFDIVLCAEVLEHAQNWREIVDNAYRLLKFGGMFIGTAASTGRPAHKCSGEPMPNPPDEHYENINQEELKAALSSAKFHGITIDIQAEDIRWIGEK